MKKSIAFLPPKVQEDLNYLVSEIVKRLPQTEMVVLYGSYARNTYVRRDIRVTDGGIPTVKISDYDLLVLTKGISSKKAEATLNNIEDLFFHGKYYDRDTPVQFITEDIATFNKYIEKGRYFYTELKKDGVMLYDSERFKLARRRKLDFTEIKQQAQEYYDEKFARAYSFLCDAQGAYNREDYRQASFHLHQACENYYYAIRLTFTQQNSRQHNLDKLSKSVKKYSDDLAGVFPKDTPEEIRLFDLLKASYVNARYDPEFVATKEDIDALIPKVELLRDITERICEEKIREYGEGEKK